jgi:DNA-binding transcriptional LysR family regulator
MTNYNHWFIRARLKTRQLLLLVALAEEGNIHRAAQVLNMTQPAASKLLKDLEDVLEVPLFERLPRGMRPTWYGETMIRHARVALASLNQAHDELTALKAGRFGHVSVGAITAPGLTLMPPAVAMVKREQPDLRVSLEIETSPVLIERLEQGKLDILVARLFAEHDKSQLRYEALTEEPVCALVRPGHPLLGVSGLTLRDVVSAGWIVPPAGSVLRHRFELMFQEEGWRRRPTPSRARRCCSSRACCSRATWWRCWRPTWRATTPRTASCRCCRWTCPATWTPSASSRAPTGCCRRPRR